VDLDTFPFLTLQLRKPLADAPVADAIRVIDHETQQALLLTEGGDPYAYRAFDLRGLFPTGGKRKISIKYYHLGASKPGDYVVLDFLRLEAAH
jgi:hypothetical protein